MTLISDGEYDEDLQLALDDSGVTLKLCYASGAPTFNPQTGRVRQTLIKESVTGLVEELPIREIEQSHGLYQVNDRRFFVRVTDVSQTPTTRDRLIHGGYRYELIGAELDPTERLHVLVGRRKGATTTTTTSTSTTSTSTTTGG